ncbi:MAG: histidine kinase-, gyrase and HSP90-like ATPase family protein [bacterium]|nr:histidine kinase-, gyrase and HSP90-like ATPase family protein [bacterium]
MLLHQFLTDNRAELIARCRAKVAKRPAAKPTGEELKHGVPAFLAQLTRTLLASSASERRDISGPAEPGRSAVRSEIGDTAASHGSELLRMGYTVEQVVHDYGDLCQSVTELAVEQRAPITAEDFRTLNQCLDNAIAGAVTEYGRQRDQNRADEGAATSNERLGSLGHELRSLVHAAMLAVEAVKTGAVGFSGATGAVLDLSLIRLRDLIDLSFADEMRVTGVIPARQVPDRD